MAGRKDRQLGEFLMARWVLLMLILMAMLVVPIWLKRGGDNQQIERDKAEALAANGTPVSSTVTATVTATAEVAPAAPRQIGYGLTFVQGAPSAETPTDMSHLTCHGEPKPGDRPHKDSCNPYQRDTSCRVVLPVLCMKASGQGESDGNSANNYMAGTLGATAPVMGALLDSREAGSKRCEKELGQGWRMADFHAGGGWQMRGKTSKSLAGNGSTRYWVAIDDNPGNCWDSAP